MIRKHPLLVVFTLLYSLAFLVWALRAGNGEFLFYFAIMVALILLVMWANVRAKFTMSVLWMLSVWGLLHMAGGNYPISRDGIGFGTSQPAGDHTVLYNLWLLPNHILKYDQLVHAFGFYVATHACWQALRRFITPTSQSVLALLVVTACAGMGLGAANEVVEYIATLLGPSNVGDYDNNAQDLVFNMTGAAVAALIIGFGLQRGWGRDTNAVPTLAGVVLTTIASVVVGLGISSATSGRGVTPQAQASIESGSKLRTIAQAAIAFQQNEATPTNVTIDALVQSGVLAVTQTKSSFGPARDGGADYVLYAGVLPVAGNPASVVLAVDRAAIVNSESEVNYVLADGTVVFATTSGLLQELIRPANRPMLEALAPLGQPSTSY